MVVEIFCNNIVNIQQKDKHGLSFNVVTTLIHQKTLIAHGMIIEMDLVVFHRTFGLAMILFTSNLLKFIHIAIILFRFLFHLCLPYFW